MNKALRFLSILLLCLCEFLFACNKEDPTPTKIDYDNTNLTLTVGDTFFLDIKEDVNFKVAGDVVKFDEATKTLTAVKSGDGSITATLKANENVKLIIVIKVEDKIYSLDELLSLLKDIKAKNSFEIDFELKDGGAIVYSEEITVLNGEYTFKKKELNSLDQEGEEALVETVQTEASKAIDQYNLKLDVNSTDILENSINITKDSASFYTNHSCTLKYFDRYTMNEPRIIVTLTKGAVSEINFSFEVDGFFGSIIVQIK